MIGVSRWSVAEILSVEDGVWYWRESSRCVDASCSRFRQARQYVYIDFTSSFTPDFIFPSSHHGTFFVCAANPDYASIVILKSRIRDERRIESG